MTMSDPIADMLTRIRNANTAKHDTVDVPSSKMKLAIANILLDEGYIENYEIVEDGVFKTIHIVLKYGADKNEKVITGLKRISKPGLRVYAGSADVPKVFGGLGTAIAGWMLEFSKFDGTLAMQPQSCIDMLHIMYLWLPLVIDVLIMLVLSRMNVEETNEKIKAKKKIEIETA